MTTFATKASGKHYVENGASCRTWPCFGGTLPLSGVPLPGCPSSSLIYSLIFLRHSTSFPRNHEQGCFPQPPCFESLYRTDSLSAYRILNSFSLGILKTLLYPIQSTHGSTTDRGTRGHSDSLSQCFTNMSRHQSQAAGASSSRLDGT